MPFKIAAICTQYYPLSHTDVIITRWLEPHVNDIHVGWKPVTQIAALHVVQFPHGDPPPDDWFIAGMRLRNDPMLRAAPANLVGLSDFVRHFARLDREIQKFFIA